MLIGKAHVKATLELWDQAGEVEMKDWVICLKCGCKFDPYWFIKESGSEDGGDILTICKSCDEESDERAELEEEARLQRLVK